MNDNFSKVIKKRKIAKRIAVLFSFLILVFIAAVTLNCYTEYLEIKEIGVNFTSAYIKNIVTKTIVQTTSFIFVFALLLVNILYAKNVLKKQNIERGFLGNSIVICLFSVLISMFIGNFISSDLFEKYLLFCNSTEFGITDPVFNTDISFYVFKREFLYSVLQYLLTVWFIVTVLVAIMYILLYIRLGERTFVDLVHDNKIVTHIFINVVICLILSAANMFFSAHNVLFSNFATELIGCGFIKDKIWINYYRVMPFVIIILTVLGWYFLKKDRPKKVLYCVAVYIIIFLSANVISFCIDMFYISPNEVSVEKQYINNNIKFTKYAYGLNNIIETEYDYSDLGDNFNKIDNDVLENLRIVDYQSTITSTNQLQSFKNYYQFKDMDVNIYEVDGAKKAVLSGARELEIDNLDETAKNYLNQKFRYTHGYGLVVAALNAVSDNGKPEYLIKDLKNNSSVEGLKITQPRIYFGELNSNNVIVNTKVGEIDYVDGTEDKIYNYTGKAGIKLNPVNRILFALKIGDFRMLISNQITSESKLLLNQNILERLNLVAPFIKFDPDVHIVADDGSLKWIVDGYSYTDKFPYSQYTDGVNYIRNSVKAVVDAYNGTVKLYVMDKNDPIIRTYTKIYPDLFEKEELSSSLKNKVKYPEWLFNIQCNIYAKYHVDTAEAFYNKNDLYAVASEKYSDDVKAIEPYYNILKLDEFNKNESELVLMLPYTPYNRENMTAWIAVGNEGDNYGKFVAYTFPKDITVYGPLQIENMIDNNPEISKELTLWNSGGSKVIRGNLMAVPINNSLLYIEPVYLNSENQASLPELKRIIAVYNGNIAMTETIAEALTQVTSNMNISLDDNKNDIQQTDIDNDSAINTSDLIAIYEQLEKASKEGDWSAFGEALDEFKTYVEDVKKFSEKDLTKKEE